MKIEMNFNDLDNMDPVVFPMQAYLVGLAQENRGYLNSFHNILAEMILFHINSKEQFEVFDVCANLINHEMPHDLFVAALDVLNKNKMLRTDEFNVLALNALLKTPFEYTKRIFDDVITQGLGPEQFEKRLHKIVEELTSKNTDN